MSKQEWIIVGVLCLMVAATAWIARAAPGDDWRRDPIRMAYSPLHFKPAILQATDAECLACHREVLEDKPRAASPAGLQAAEARAWYQQTSTYSGEQESFHRRHLVTPYAQQVMNLKCNTCHEGHDPRDEAQGTSATGPGRDDRGFALRKQVNPEISCLKCHGQMPWKNMALPGPWTDFAKDFGNSCLDNCHEKIRTNRHQVSYLKAEAIEAAGRRDSEVCHGCHGGRPWYRTSYPYPRHAWPDMPKTVPDWAAGRPTESEERFRTTPAARTFKP